MYKLRMNKEMVITADVAGELGQTQLIYKLKKKYSIG